MKQGTQIIIVTVALLLIAAVVEADDRQYWENYIHQLEQEVIRNQCCHYQDPLNSHHYMEMFYADQSRQLIQHQLNSTRTYNFRFSTLPTFNDIVRMSMPRPVWLRDQYGNWRMEMQR